jgi:mannose-6-phosphate isomerase-like protein (cupin superfamily)
MPESDPRARASAPPQGPLDLRVDAVHLDHGTRALPVLAFNHDYDAYIAKFCAPGAPGRLVTLATSEADWPVWEVHPEGDELVVVISGRARFIQDFDGEHTRMELGPGEAVLNPAGVPHTADVLAPFTALYITPGPGTEHRPR